MQGMPQNTATDSIELKPCFYSHWRALARIIRSEMKMDTETTRYYLTHCMRTMGVAVQGGKAVGCYIYYDVPTPNVAWLGIIAVDPACQGRGIGKALLERLEWHVAIEGYSRIEMSVDPANTGAQRFYEREGYGRVDRPGTGLTYAKEISPRGNRHGFVRKMMKITRKIEFLQNRMAYPLIVRGDKGPKRPKGRKGV